MAECHLDFLTSSDIAYTLWQLFNSHEDWKAKLKGEEKGDRRYKCNTRFTKERSKFAEGDGNSDGMKLYKKCHDWTKKTEKLGRGRHGVIQVHHEQYGSGFGTSQRLQEKVEG